MKYVCFWAGLMVLAGAAFAEEIQCPGAYDGHLQGIAVDAEGNIYWSFTVALVKTDAHGTLLREVEVPTHHGDLGVEQGTVYAAMNHRAEEGVPGQRTSWIYAYKADDLSFLWRKPVPEVVYGAGGLAMRDGHFFIVSGRLPKDHSENYVYEYDSECTFIAKHLLKSGYTYLGIQTIAYAEGTWWFGCYGNPPETIRAGEGLSFEKQFAFDCSTGIAPAPGGGFYIGRGGRNAERKNTGTVIKVAQPAPEVRKEPR